MPDLRKGHGHHRKQADPARFVLRTHRPHAKPVFVTTRAGSNEEAADAWRAMRDDSDLQFEPIPPPEVSPPPEWLQSLGEFFVNVFSPVARAFAASWPVLQWVLIAVGIALLALLIARIFGLQVFRRPTKAETAELDLTPDRAEAQALLSDADALAAQGRYGEAVRLLLARSIGQIANRRPDLVHPSSTARELGMLEALPDAARRAFNAIARAVERALFALEDLDERDWTEARAAYADFALERG